MKKKINMLQLVNGFAIGGGELKLLELVENLNRDKYNITICSVGQGGPLEQKFKDLGLEVFVFEKRHSFDFRLVTFVKKLMEEKQIQLLQTTLFYADVIGAYAAMMAKVPIVISWEAVSHPYKRRHLMAYSIAKRKMDRIVAVSNAIRTQVIQERNVTPQKVMTIQYGVDVNKFDQHSKLKRKEFDLQEDDLVIGTVARFTYQKGHKYLISGALEIVKKFPNAKFVFVGDGPLRSELENQISELNLTDHFRFLGFRNDVKDCVNLFDLFVLPSIYEGLPNVVLEAMACSRPVIATSVDGTVEAVEDGVTGFLVPPHNTAILTDRIMELLGDDKRLQAMGNAGRKRVEEFFYLEKQVAEFEKLYDELINEKLL